MEANEITYTNSSLSTARSCLTKYDFKYLQRLERDADEDREALQVGSCWSVAFEVQPGEDVSAPYQRIAKHAPSPLWTVKLQRLFAAYLWYWKDDNLEVIQPEREFEVMIQGRRHRGKMDALVRTVDGRIGVLERKTTSDSVEADSSYWDRLLLDVQTGIYALALWAERKQMPDFIVYDAVRKPTIRPKGIAKKEVARMRAELAKEGIAHYFGEAFDAEAIEHALDAEHESDLLYGARLTSDIGDDPGKYFGRREVARTKEDFRSLLREISAQEALIEYARANSANGFLHRNPDACNVFGRCEFFRLCSHNIRPQEGDAPPDGFRRRERLHPELS